jgi:hypothetical protein
LEDISILKPKTVKSCSSENKNTEKCSKNEKGTHITRILNKKIFFSGRTGLTIPVFDTSREPEDVEPVLVQNRKGEQDDKIAPPCLMPLHIK